MRIGYFIDTLTSVDIGEIIRKGDKVLEIYEVAFIERIMNWVLLEKIMIKLFALR